jgi:hypothetical protein
MDLPRNSCVDCAVVIVAGGGTRGPTRCSSRLFSTTSPQRSFTYGAISWADDSDRLALEIRIEPRRANRPICSGCHRKGPGHARLR